MHLALSGPLLLLYLVLLTVPGLVAVRSVASRERDILVIVPISMFVGLSLFLLLLNLALYLAPFSYANRILPFVLFVAAVLLAQKGTFQINEYKLDLDFGERRVFSILAFGIALAFSLVVWGTFYADNIWHASLAMTIRNGNTHPLMWPWYPDYHYAYHYGFDLLMASTQDFCGINQFYSDKPWHVLIAVGIFAFLVGFVKRSFGGNFRAGICAGIFCLFLSSLSFPDALRGIFHVVQTAINISAREAYESLAEMYRRPSHEPIALFDASLHRPSLIKYPVYFAFVYLYVHGNKQGRGAIAHVVIHALLLAFLCLGDESMFGLACAGMSLFWLAEFLRAERGQRLAIVLRAASILLLAGIVAIVQGGYFTTLLFHGNDQYPPGSLLHTGGQYDRFAIRPTPYFASRPLLTFDLHVWRAFFMNYALPLTGFIALHWRIFRQREPCSKEWFDAFLVWCFTFWVGFLLAGLVYIPFADQMISRLYPWPVASASVGIWMALWVWPKLEPRSKFRRLLALLLIAVLCFSTFVRMGAGACLSVAYQFSNEKKRRERWVDFGQWIEHNIPPGSRTLGAEPRYTGRFSWGGHPERDAAMFSESELQRFEAARTHPDYEFLKMNKVTHFVLNAEHVQPSRSDLSDTNRFAEIRTPFTRFWRLYEVR